MTPLQIVPHPCAPLFNGSDRQKVLQQVAAEIGSGHIQQSETYRQYFRQAGYVNLWFFLKHICGYSGPFDLLNDDLHVDMCNFRQTLLRPGSRGAMFIPRGHYKDLATDTPVLTANRGWVNHGDLVVGDEVFAPSGKRVKILALSERFYSRAGYKITFSDGSEVTCGDTHLWRVVRHKRKRIYRGRKTAEPGYKYYTKNLSYREDEIVEAWELYTKDDVGVLESPLEYPTVDLPLDPYFLGVWLGDGNSAGPRITYHNDDKETITRLLEKGFTGKEYYGGENTSYFSFYGLLPVMRELNVLNNKHIPNVYKTSSASQRMELLKGLMDTDGSAGGGKNKNTATFCNTNSRLVEDVYELAASLALRPRKRKYTTTVNGKPYVFYQVSFQHFTDRNPFYLSRKVVLAKPKSLHREYRGIREITEVTIPESSCIQVEGGMYLVGKELIPTHNSTIVTEGGGAWELLRNPNLRIRISNEKEENAGGFMHTIKDIFEYDEFVAWLYGNPDDPWGSYVPKDKTRWNNTEIVMPNRTRRFREASVEFGGITGAVAGHHFDLHVIDDMVSTWALNSMGG